MLSVSVICGLEKRGWCSAFERTLMNAVSVCESGGSVWEKGSGKVLWLLQDRWIGVCSD